MASRNSPRRCSRPRASMRDTAAGLLIGALGGWPSGRSASSAPWLAGSMMAAIAAVFSRPDRHAGLAARAVLHLPRRADGNLGDVGYGGAGRAVALVHRLLCLTVIAVTWACAAYYVKRSEWDGPTALFASLPGALSLVLLLASGTKADMRRVTIAQCIRLFFLKAALPLGHFLAIAAGAGPRQCQRDRRP